MILDGMIKRLPLYERKNKIIIEIFDAEAKQFELMEDQISDIRKQFFVDTATWGLKVYEKELKIVVPSNSTLDSRRAAIKAKMRSGGKVDRALLESVASAILRTVVKIEFTGRILFYIEVNDDELGNVGLFHKAIYDIKPAHLPMDLELRISSTAVIQTKEYTFPVPYPVTGTFHTAPIDGVASKATAAVETEIYANSVPYPVTGTFYCSEGVI